MRSCSMTCASTVALACVCAVLLAAMLRPRPAEADEKLTMKTGPISVMWSEGDRPVLEYRYAEVPFKPYVKQFFTPGGVGVLRDSPEDHKHHHSLMFAIAADDVTFWDESPKAGKQVHKSFSGTRLGERGGLSTAELAETLEWTAPDGSLLLKEVRKIEAVKGAAPGASLLTWTTRLEAAPGKASVRLGGSHYYGLGARFLVSMDTGGSFFNADAKTGEVVRGDERVTPSRWCAYTAVADGKPVTFSMFDHPENERHPALWFTMGAPFAYLSATINLWREPYALEAGKPLTFTYGVALWDGKVGPEQVESLYRRWLELMGTGKPKPAPK